MKALTLADWAREQFMSLMGEAAESLWSEAEELRKRRKLLDSTVQEGRFLGKFSADKPTKSELLVPIFSADSWTEFISHQERSAEVSAYLFAGLLPWQNRYFQEYLTPAGFIPKDDQGSGPGTYSVLSTTLLQELYEKLERDPFIIFHLRGRGKDEVIDALRSVRAKLLGRRESSSELVVSEDISLSEWDFVSPELFELSYSLRADELPALLFRRVESIPLPAQSEVAEAVLSELYVQIAKRAQAYGLSFRR